MASARYEGAKRPVSLGFKVIGLLKIASALLAVAIGFGLLKLFREDVQATLEMILRAIRLDPENLLARTVISSLSGLDRSHQHLIEAGIFGLATLHLVEGFGILTGRRWGAYLIVLATCSLLPVECYEIYHKPGPLRVVALAINLGIVAFLIANWGRLSKTEG